MNIHDFGMKYLENPKHRGTEINSICPFCGKKKFYLNHESGKFLCFSGSCGEKGGIDKLKKHLGIEEEIETAKQKPIRQHVPTGKVNWKKEDFKVIRKNSKVAEYLESRMISDETAKAMRVLLRGNAMSFFLTEGDNNIVGIKYRTVDKKIWAESNSKATLWNKDLVNNDNIIITEGEIDAMTVYEAGYKNVVSVPFGTQNLDWIKNDLEWLKKKKEIILLMDNDLAGRNAERKIISKIGLKQIKVCNLGKYKDINEVAVTDGIMACREVLESARQPDIDGITNIEDIARFDINQVDRFLTGIKKLDKCLRGLKETELTVIAGDNGSGKSTLVAQIMLNAIEQNRKCFVFNGELGKEMFKEWLILQANGSEGLEKREDRLTGDVDFVASEENYNKINEWLKGYMYMFTDKKATDSEVLLEKMEQSADKDDTFVYVIDNLTTVTFPNDGKSKAEQQGEFVVKLKDFAKNRRKHVILVNHITKQQENVGKHLIKGSGTVTDIADNVIMPEIKDGEEGYDGELHIEKNRLFGTLGTVRTSFNATTKRICCYEFETTENSKTYSWNKQRTYYPF